MIVLPPVFAVHSEEKIHQGLQPSVATWCDSHGGCYPQSWTVLPSHSLWPDANNLQLAPFPDPFPCFQRRVQHIVVPGGTLNAQPELTRCDSGTKVQERIKDHALQCIHDFLGKQRGSNSASHCLGRAFGSKSLCSPKVPTVRSKPKRFPIKVPSQEHGMGGVATTAFLDDGLHIVEQTQLIARYRILRERSFVSFTPNQQVHHEPSVSQSCRCSVGRGVNGKTVSVDGSILSLHQIKEVHLDTQHSQLVEDRQAKFMVSS